MNNHYLSQIFDIYSLESTRAFDELSFWSSLFGRLIMDRVPLKPQAIVLDLACATGFPLFELAERLGPDSQITGVDLWENALDVARAKVTARQLKNITLLYADAGNLPFADNSFDLITCNLGINNFESPETVLAQCRRVLKKECIFAATSNLTGHMQEFYQVLRTTLQEQGLHSILAPLQDHIDHRGNKENITQLFHQAGFRIKLWHEETFNFRYVDATAFFNSYFVKACFLPAWRKLIPDQNLFAVFAEVEQRLNKIASTRGELTMTIPAVYFEAAAKD